MLHAVHHFIANTGVRTLLLTRAVLMTSPYDVILVQASQKSLT